MLRGLQRALAGTIAPEVKSLFALDTLQTAQMLLELLASEWDTAAETLAGDNETLTGILGRAEPVLRDRGGDLAALADEIAGALGKPSRPSLALSALADEIAGALGKPSRPSLALSALSARNGELRLLLERVLVACEEAVGDPAGEALMPLRAETYGHLREAAVRGWSFWDAVSFRERMAQVRAEKAAGQQM